MMKQVRKPFIVGTNYQRTISTGTLVSYLISSCGINCSSNLIICYILLKIIEGPILSNITLMNFV